MKRLNQSGSHIVALVLFVLVAAVIGFAGYTVHQRQNDVADSTTATAKVPATIKNTANLTEASKVLDNSSTQLDSGLNDSALDTDLNSML